MLLSVNPKYDDVILIKLVFAFLHFWFLIQLSRPLLHSAQILQGISSGVLNKKNIYNSYMQTSGTAENVWIRILWSDSRRGV
jgi:hypothetical protein